ncbi:MAG: GYD domain-containing protein [Candidatus Hodarchaeota archaeon]
MHYIILGNYTKEGILKIKEAPQRLEQAQKVAKSFGGEIKQFFSTMGRYDFVAITEAPSHEAALKAILVVAGAGAVRTETLTAITAEEFAKILKELP